MSDKSKQTEKPEEIADETLEAAQGGWGHRMYYSYSSDKSASYTTTSSNTADASGSTEELYGAYQTPTKP